MNDVTRVGSNHQTGCWSQAKVQRADWRPEPQGREPVRKPLQNLKTTQVSTAGEWLNQLEYGHATEYYVGVQKSEVDFRKRSKIYCSVKRTRGRTICALASHSEAKTRHSPADTCSTVWRKHLEGYWENCSQMLSLRDDGEGEVLLFHFTPYTLLDFDHELIVLSQGCFVFAFRCFRTGVGGGWG